MAEVIDLLSDDDEAPKARFRSANTECINFKCTSGIEIRKAPIFVCKYYGVNPNGKKRRKICAECLKVAIQHRKTLENALRENRPIFECEFPDHTMEVEISDSDSEEEEVLPVEGCLSEGQLIELEKQINLGAEKVEKICNLDDQFDSINKQLNLQFLGTETGRIELDQDIKATMEKMDELRTSFYDFFKPEIRVTTELDILEGSFNKVKQLPPPTPKLSPQVQTTSAVAKKKVAPINPLPIQPKKQPTPQQDSQPEILHEVGRDSRQLNLPPVGPLLKIQPDVDSFVFVMKYSMKPWVHAKVISIISRAPLNCKVKLIPKKYNNAIQIFNGKNVAVTKQSATIIPVGIRVVAIFCDANGNYYYSGIIAETPKSPNKHRYLVFFDDGYAQYVTHENIFVVCESSTLAHLDVPKESQDFIKKYLDTYPERPMVKLLKGQMIKTELDGKWFDCEVIEVDASLVHVKFETDNRWTNKWTSQWIYRGSARLRPLYVELLKANARQQGHHIINTNRLRVPQKKPNLPYVEYTSLTTEVESSGSKSPLKAQQQIRAVAKKSTAKKSLILDTSHGSSSSSNQIAVNDIKKSHGIVPPQYYSVQNTDHTKIYVPHTCGPACLSSVPFTPEDMKIHNPLAVPLMCGWSRQICMFSKTKKNIIYKTPCGVRLRNIQEVHHYLRVTKSQMSVDLFEFDTWVHCLSEFVLDKCFVTIKDISYGIENVPIPCVNELSHSLPDNLRYRTERIPTEGVHINTDPEFLCGCDCEDDCQDKEKCACWQLTLKGAATLSGQVLNNAVGYVYKRLPEQVLSGIYECNSKCKCNVNTCLNRVVQHPLKLKLQVFKTAKRGWGIRCMNDIPHGTFICIYAGKLLDEQRANEGGKNYGDEYLAELDYIEVMERIKDGYESDVVEPDNATRENENESSSNASSDYESPKTNVNDSDDDFEVNSSSINNVEGEENIRKRLRKRKRKNKPSKEKTNVPESINEGMTNSSSSSETKSISSKSGPSEALVINISDDEDTREPNKFDLSLEPEIKDNPMKFQSVRKLFGKDEAVYIMDAKTEGNIGRYLNHSCDPNVFVQNVFVDTHDVRFPWVAFFALTYIPAGHELMWNYSYDVGTIPGKSIVCHCEAENCRGRLL